MKKYWLLLFLFIVGLVWSGINPTNQWHWIGEISPNVIGLAILIIMFPKFRFTFPTYIIILISCWFIFIGAHYTFSRVPYIKEIGQIVGSERNNFDKIGHFMQGIVPVLISREIFLRLKIVNRKWIGFIAFCVCMTTTAVYEIIEFIVCLIAGKQVESFTGMQGYLWDSQTDMLAALIGGLIIVFFFQKMHNRSIEKEFPEEIDWL
jgi:putative membrane protein